MLQSLLISQNDLIVFCTILNQFQFHPLWQLFQCLHPWKCYFFLSEGGIERKIDGTAISAWVYIPYPRKLWSFLPGNEIHEHVMFTWFKKYQLLISFYTNQCLIPNFEKGEIFRKFKESNAQLLFIFVIWSSTTLRYTTVYSRASTSKSWKSFLRKI